MTPPPQFKAEGAAGVINIILRKKRSKGLTGSVQGSIGDGGRSVVGADSSYSSGPLTASANAGYRRDYRQRVTESDTVAPDPTTGMLITNTSTTREKVRRAVPTVGSSVEYALNEAQSISAAARWGHRGGCERTPN